MQENINTPEYWDEVYRSEPGLRTNEELFKLVTSQVPATANIFELGCGKGALALHIQDEKPTVTYYGMDFSKEAVRTACSFGLHAVEWDIREVDWEDTRLYDFDTVIMMEVLEHLDRPDAVDVLAGIRSGVIPDRLLITTPNRCMGPEDVPEHTALFSPQYLVDLLVEAGYNDDTHDFHLADIQPRLFMAVLAKGCQYYQGGK